MCLASNLFSDHKTSGSYLNYPDNIEGSKGRLHGAVVVKVSLNNRCQLSKERDSVQERWTEWRQREGLQGGGETCMYSIVWEHWFSLGVTKSAVFITKARLSLHMCSRKVADILGKRPPQQPLRYQPK